MEWYFDLVFADIGFPLASVGEESKITNSKMPKKVPTQARKEFSDTYSVSTVIIETNLIEKHSDTTEKDERMHSMIQNERSL
jgi:hypothetical protein